jgi:hypothetical protein
MSRRAGIRNRWSLPWRILAMRCETCGNSLKSAGEADESAGPATESAGSGRESAGCLPELGCRLPALRGNRLPTGKPGGVGAYLWTAGSSSATWARAEVVVHSHGPQIAVVFPVGVNPGRPGELAVAVRSAGGSACDHSKGAYPHIPARWIRQQVAGRLRSR